MSHTAENDAAPCAEEACRAWAIRIGEDPAAITCYLCRPSVTPPAATDEVTE